MGEKKEGIDSSKLNQNDEKEKKEDYIRESVRAEVLKVLEGKDDIDEIFEIWVKYYYNWYYEKAIVCFEKIIEINPEYAKAYNNWGIVLKDLNRKEEAIEKYKKATEINPELAEAYNNWGNVLDDLNRKEEAIEKYKKATEINPEYAKAYYNWGIVLDDLNRKEEAIEKYKKATEINPEYADAYNNWGNVLDDLNRKEEAIEKYKKATEINPEAKAYYNWGIVLDDLNRKEEAIEKYKKATEINPKYADAYNNWGNALCWLKKYEEAMKFYRKCFKLNPEYLTVYWNISYIENRLENLQKAYSLWEITRIDRLKNIQYNSPLFVKRVFEENPQIFWEIIQKPDTLFEPIVKIYEKAVENSRNTQDLIDFILSSKYTPFPDEKEINEDEKQIHRQKLAWIITYYSEDYLKAERYFERVDGIDENDLQAQYYYIKSRLGYLQRDTDENNILENALEIAENLSYIECNNEKFYYAWQIFTLEQERLEDFLDEIEEEMDKRKKLIENWELANEKERYFDLLLLYNVFEKEDSIDYSYSQNQRPKTREGLEKELMEIEERKKEIKSRLYFLYNKSLDIFKVYWWEKLESEYMELLMYHKLWKTKEKNEKIQEIINIEKNMLENSKVWFISR